MSHFHKQNILLFNLFCIFSLYLLDNSPFYHKTNGGRSFLNNRVKHRYDYCRARPVASPRVTMWIKARKVVITGNVPQYAAKVLTRWKLFKTKSLHRNGCKWSMKWSIHGRARLHWRLITGGDREIMPRGVKTWQWATYVL